jgi:hypothetical protein
MIRALLALFLCALPLPLAAQQAAAPARALSDAELDAADERAEMAAERRAEAAREAAEDRRKREMEDYRAANLGPPTPFGVAMYKALVGGAGSRDVAAYLRDAITAMSGTCIDVRAFQNVAKSARLETYKVECVGSALVLVSVGPSGGLMVEGGNGRIADFDPEDGAIVALRVKKRSAGSADPALPAASVTPVAAPVESRRDLIKEDAEAQSGALLWVFWLLGGIALVIVVIIRMLYSQAAWRRRLARAGHDGPFLSADRDDIEANSPEISPGLWHDARREVFMALGRRGKRRLFRSRWAAYAYRRWGVKAFQVR